MIVIADVLEVHQKSIADFGGSQGVRDVGLLEAALARPFQTFDGDDLYPTVFEKAGALGESLIQNHPFVDGNKRTGLLAMVSFLINNECSVTSFADDLYSFIIDISIGAISFDEIVEWLRANTVKEKENNADVATVPRIL